ENEPASSSRPSRIVSAAVSARAAAKAAPALGSFVQPAADTPTQYVAARAGATPTEHDTASTANSTCPLTRPTLMRAAAAGHRPGATPSRGARAAARPAAPPAPRRARPARRPPPARPGA